MEELKVNNIIHVHIYEPHKPSIFGKNKNDRSKLFVYRCDHRNDCDAFKKHQCINVGNAFGARCPVGSTSKTDGFTQRAGKYHSQISEWKETYKDKYQYLDSAPKRIVKVHGGWMLPYSHIDMNETVPFKSKSGFFMSGCPFLTDEQMTAENIENIVTYVPHAMMGGAIKSYQKEVIPKFLHDFKVNYPEEFSELTKGKLDHLLEDINYVGRKAYLKTVKPNVKVKLGTNWWSWDGKKIYKNDASFIIFKPCEHESCYCELIPSDKATVKITDNAQVNGKTLFAD